MVPMCVKVLNSRRKIVITFPFIDKIFFLKVWPMWLKLTFKEKPHYQSKPLEEEIGPLKKLL